MTDQLDRDDAVTALILDAVERAGAASHAKALAAAFIEHCVTVTPPRLVMTGGGTNIEMITLDRSPMGGGVSVKPGNLVINMEKSIVAGAGGVLGLVGVSASPWLAPLAVLVLWKQWREAMQIDLSERHAMVIYALWTHRDPLFRVPKASVRTFTQDVLAQHDRPEMTDPELDHILDDLVRIGSIEEAKTDRAAWWLREWVRIAYPRRKT